MNPPPADLQVPDLTTALRSCSYPYENTRSASSITNNSRESLRDKVFRNKFISKKGEIRDKIGQGRRERGRKKGGMEGGREIREREIGDRRREEIEWQREGGKEDSKTETEKGKGEEDWNKDKRRERQNRKSRESNETRMY